MQHYGETICALSLAILLFLIAASVLGIIGLAAF